MSYKDPRNNKAQASSAELLLAYFIFGICLTVFVTLWTATTEKINSGERFDDFEALSVNIAEKLVRTPGYPSNWSAENVTVVGLANEPRILDNEKVLAFIDLMNDSKMSSNAGCNGITNYECNKALLGVGKHDFYLELQYMNWSSGNWTKASVENINCTAGKVPVNDVEKITIMRTALFQQNITRVMLTLWHNETGAL
jgi:hypothetical protein